MPYIHRDRVFDIDHGDSPETPGELNYAITRLVLAYLDGADRSSDRVVSYGAINEVMGVLECAKLEFYRRICAPYEDGKIAENGDVY